MSSVVRAFNTDGSFSWGPSPVTAEAEGWEMTMHLPHFVSTPLLIKSHLTLAVNPSNVCFPYLHSVWTESDLFRVWTSTFEEGTAPGHQTASRSLTDSTTADCVGWKHALKTVKRHPVGALCILLGPDSIASLPLLWIPAWLSFALTAVLPLLYRGTAADTYRYKVSWAPSQLASLLSHNFQGPFGPDLSHPPPLCTPSAVMLHTYSPFCCLSSACAPPTALVRRSVSGLNSDGTHWSFSSIGTSFHP